MALPNELKSARMVGTDSGGTTDEQMGNLETAVADILGIPIDTSIDTPLRYVKSSAVETDLSGTSEANLLTLSIPTGTLKVDDVLEFEFNCYLKADDPNTSQIWFRLESVSYETQSVTGALGSTDERIVIFKGTLSVRSTTIAILNILKEVGAGDIDVTGLTVTHSGSQHLVTSFNGTSAFDIHIRGNRDANTANDFVRVNSYIVKHLRVS